jgi:hypothetical protein
MDGMAAKKSLSTFQSRKLGEYGENEVGNSEASKYYIVSDYQLATEFKMSSSASHAAYLRLVNDLLLEEHIIKRGRIREPIHD